MAPEGGRYSREGLAYQRKPIWRDPTVGYLPLGFRFPSGLCGVVVSPTSTEGIILSLLIGLVMDQLSPEYFEEHAVHVARVVFAAALLDDSVTTFIAEFLDLEDYQENALLRPMQSRAKIDLLQRLTNHYVGGDTAKAMAKLCQAAKDALNDRNALIHGVSTEVDGKLAFRSWVGKSKLTGEPELWPVERVCALAQTLLSLMDAIDELIEGFRDRKASELERREPND